MPNPTTRSWAPSQSSVIKIAAAEGQSDALICFSHLRWDFVFQRPQHLLTRFADSRRVFVFEEPLKAEPDCGPSLDVRLDPKSRVVVATPKLPEGLAGFGKDVILRQLLDELVAEHGIERPTLWYYTPMMLPFSRHLAGRAAVVYDCMDELANFRFAPPELKALGARADGARRRRVHRRLQPLRGQARPARQRPSLPLQRRPRPFRQGPRADARRPGRHRRPAPPASRLLRRDRRADGPGAVRQDRRRAPRMDAGHGRAGGEDQRGRPAAPAEHPLARRQDLRRAARLSRRAGTWR